MAIKKSLTDSALSAQIDALGAVLDDGLILVTARGVVQYANAVALAFLGARIQNAPLQNFLRHPDFLPALRAAIDTAEATEFIHQIFAHQTEHRAPYELRVRLCALGGSPDERDYAILLLTDMSGQRVLDKLRTDFVANVSHELRSPLTSLAGFLETLIDGASATSPDTQARFLRIMQEEVARMTRLTDDLLTLSQKEADRHIAPTDYLPIIDIVAGIVDIFSARATQAQRSLTVNYDAGISAPIYITGDADDVAMIFTNLLDNALKYSDANSDIRLDVALIDNATKIRIAVANRCPDIAPEHLARLTERFYRIDSARAREIGGTGLGLAIVKHIANRHNATLDITSTNGTTRFALVFDLYTPDSA